MKSEMTNNALLSAINEVNHEILHVAESAMMNAYDNVLELVETQMNIYLMVLGDHANVLQTSYGSRFDKIYKQKLKIWSTYYKLSEIYGKVAQMRYNNQIRAKH